MNTHFSIIMPTYNQASFIRRAILSLQKQTYPYWELIIINDGSTDNTELLFILNNGRILYLKNSEKDIKESYNIFIMIKGNRYLYNYLYIQ